MSSASSNQERPSASTLRLITQAFGTPNDVDPAARTNFNSFDTDINDAATAAFAGTLVDLSGNSVPGVGFSVTNNLGKATGLTAVSGSSGPGLFNDATIFGDCYGGANVGNNSRADFGNLAADANLVLTFSGLSDDFTYTVERWL